MLERENDMTNTTVTARQIINAASGAVNLAEYIKSELPTLNLQTMAGADALRDAIEQLSAKRKDELARNKAIDEANSDQPKSDKYKKTLDTIRTTLNRESKREPEKGGIGIKVTFKVKDGICTFEIKEESEEGEEKRDIITTIARTLDSNPDIPDHVLEMIAEELRKYSA
jgi:hypothetical protein